MSCEHIATLTGRRIIGEYGKRNLPQGIRPVRYEGEEATCLTCKCRLIVLQESEHQFKVVELEDPCDSEPKV